MMSRFGERLLRSAKEARAIARGDVAPGRVFVPPADIDVAAVRNKTGLSQDAFAKRYGFSVGAVRDWEQGRRRPEAAARTLLIVIEQDQAAVDRALAAVA